MAALSCARTSWANVVSHAAATPHYSPVTCSFCRRRANEIGGVIAGGVYGPCGELLVRGDVYICFSCVAACSQLIE
jgi:hypothetical protein